MGNSDFKKFIKNPRDTENNFKKKADHLEFKTFLGDVKSNYAANSLNRLVSAYVMENPTIAIDFQFEDTGKHELAIQLYKAYMANAKYREPFRMYYVNFKKDCIFDKELRQNGIEIENNMIIESEKSYLDLFPKRKLVYLSPEAPHKIKSVKEDTVYIIGALTDRRSQRYKGYTLSKAIQDGIKYEKLPTDQYSSYVNNYFN